MQSMHRHDDIEINMVLRGELRYVFAGRPFTVREGETAMFWATQPHGLVDSRAGDVCWVHVPVSTVMSWNLPETELGALLQPRPVVTDSAQVRGRIDSMIPSWLEEYGTADGSSVTLLEIQAMLRRILQAPRTSGTSGTSGTSETSGADDGPFAPGIAVRPGTSTIHEDGSRRVPPERIDHMMTMARFVVENYRSALTVRNVADAAHLTPSHAMAVFRDTVGATIGEYLTMCRVAEAQRLLITTSMPTTQIAERSGFGSLSSFYAHVTAACGMAPRQYRRLAR